MMTMTKLAWVRDPNVPPGQPAEGRFTCPCGGVIGPVPFAGVAAVLGMGPQAGEPAEHTCPGCRKVYDSRGWLVRELPMPVDLPLFRRTAPQWNCVDYPGDGPHYTPGTGCAWCGMTREQIAAEWEAREAKPADEPVDWAGRTFGQLSPDEKRRAAKAAGKQLSDELTAAAPAISKIMDDPAGSVAGAVQVKRDGIVQETFAGPDPVQNSNDAFAWLLRHQGQSVDWATRHEGWEITDPAPPAGGCCGECSS